MAENMDRELGWEDEIENERRTWILHPAGDYNFTVTKFERGRHNGSHKIPPCNKAIITLDVKSVIGTGPVNVNLYLHSSHEWKLCEFFTAIGDRKHGEKLRMNWPGIIGKTGRLTLSIREWTSDDGKKHETNQVDRFIDPEEKPETPKWKAGEF